MFLIREGVGVVGCVCGGTEHSRFHGFPHLRVTNSGLEQQRMGMHKSLRLTWNSVDIS